VAVESAAPTSDDEGRRILPHVRSVAATTSALLVLILGHKQ